MRPRRLVNPTLAFWCTRTGNLSHQRPIGTGDNTTMSNGPLQCTLIIYNYMYPLTTLIPLPSSPMLLVCVIHLPTYTLTYNYASLFPSPSPTKSSPTQITGLNIRDDECITSPAHTDTTKATRNKDYKETNNALQRVCRQVRKQ